MTTPVRPVMRGVETLRTYIKDFLSGEIPKLIDIAREHWDLSAEYLPYPMKYDAYNPSLVNEYPSIGVYSVGDRQFDDMELNPDASHQYEATYAMRILVAARTPLMPGDIWLEPEKDHCIRVCTDLTSLVRAALLQTPSLGRPDKCRLDSTTLSTDYYEPTMPNTQSKRWIASSVISADFRLTEDTYAPIYGTADDLIHNIGKLTP